MKYNCCQQSDLCPNNQTCIQINSNVKPWKRFSCKCPDGYYGHNCDQRIKSCQGYAGGSRISGTYKVVRRRSNGPDKIYEVYCHFDSDGAWTLVQSFSFENHTVQDSQFKKPLTNNCPISQDVVTWSGYRLSKGRMLSISEDSEQIRFTCDFEKVHDVNSSDYLRISLTNDDMKEIMTKGDPLVIPSTSYDGKINGYNLNGCKIERHHNTGEGFHVNVEKESPCKFDIPEKPNNCDKFHYFSYFSDENCLQPVHRCTQYKNSTSQLWFGGKHAP